MIVSLLAKKKKDLIVIKSNSIEIKESQMLLIVREKLNVVIDQTENVIRKSIKSGVVIITIMTKEILTR